jgi:general secretion pathway protein I
VSRPAAGNQRGFTLIEVLVAAGVLGITATALFGVLSTSLFNLRTVEDRHRYELAAQGLMNRMTLITTLPPQGRAQGSLDEAGGAWSVQVQPWAPPDMVTSHPPEGIVKVNVTVSWPGRSIRRQIGLEALRAVAIDYSDSSLQEALGQIIPE